MAWAQFLQALDQRMADIGAARPAQAPMRVGLEGQQGQHVVDIGPHGAGPAGGATPRRSG